MQEHFKVYRLFIKQIWNCWPGNKQPSSVLVKTTPPLFDPEHWFAFMFFQWQILNYSLTSPPGFQLKQRKSVTLGHLCYFWGWQVSLPFGSSSSLQSVIFRSCHDHMLCSRRVIVERQTQSHVPVAYQLLWKANECLHKLPMKSILWCNLS